MKKIKILVLSVLMFLGMAFAAPTVRAEGEITTETPITETITTEEPVEVTEPEITLPAEWADLTPEEIACISCLKRKMKQKHLSTEYLLGLVCGIKCCIGICI